MVGLGSYEVSTIISCIIALIILIIELVRVCERNYHNSKITDVDYILLVMLTINILTIIFLSELRRIN